jgi:hypothetical protein
MPPRTQNRTVKPDEIVPRCGVGVMRRMKQGVNLIKYIVNTYVNARMKLPCKLMHVNKIYLK